MKMRWRVVLPVAGLVVFATIGVQSYRRERAASRDSKPARFGDWSRFEVDRNPANTHEIIITNRGAPVWDAVSLDRFGLTRDLPDRMFVLCALPAFVVGLGVTYELGTYGVNQEATFFLLMPLLLVAWFYFVGWLLDRERKHRATRVTTR